MSETDKKSPAALKPGNNEVAMRLHHESAQALKAHLASGTAIEDDHKEHLVESLKAALDTESHEDKEAHAPGHEDEVVALVTPVSARVALAALTEQAPIDGALKADLARRMEEALARRAETVTSP